MNEKTFAMWANAALYVPQSKEDIEVLILIEASRDRVKILPCQESHFSGIWKGYMSDLA